MIKRYTIPELAQMLTHRSTLGLKMNNLQYKQKLCQN